MPNRLFIGRTRQLTRLPSLDACVGRHRVAQLSKNTAALTVTGPARTRDSGPARCQAPGAPGRSISFQASRPHHGESRAADNRSRSLTGHKFDQTTSVIFSRRLGGFSMRNYYIVTHRVSSDPVSPFALDEVGDLKAALSRATELLLSGHLGVAIQDGVGKEIFGYDLAACCRGEKRLTSDLRVL